MDTSAAPPQAPVQAPAHWATVDFISDLHLQPATTAVFDCWRCYMQETAAQAVFILGDLFDAWPGDDAAQSPGFAADCANVLQEAAKRLTVFVMHGNRDFLIGDAFTERTGARLLPDPSLLHFAARKWLLSHGDALCLDDVQYLEFRAQVRSPAWQRDFLALPLARRQAIATALRAESEARKHDGQAYADVDHQQARRWLLDAGAHALIHGHTHRPGEHDLGDGLRRIVLSDWDATASPPRLQVLRLSAAGPQRIELRP